MADPQRPGAVTGYREQHQDRIDLVNRIKGRENELGDLYAELAEREDIDTRWLDMARTYWQQGFMFAVRAVFQPYSRL